MPYPAPFGTEIIARLGAGAVFDVALVRRDGRLVVCKRLTPRALREPAARAAMIREARALDLARHPALPELLQVGADRAGPYVLETRREGLSLRAVLDGWRARGRLPPPTLVAHVVRAAVEVLADLQDLADADGPIRLVHGDIEPEHVFLGPLGDVGLVDLGAARFRGLSPDLETSDRGTLPFVAPEVARGESAPTAAADVYALAATLAHFVTGAPLTRARDEAAVLIEIGEVGLQLDALDAAAALPPRARRAIRRALAPDPADRTPTARALLHALDDP